MAASLSRVLQRRLLALQRPPRRHHLDLDLDRQSAFLSAASTLSTLSTRSYSLSPGEPQPQPQPQTTSAASATSGQQPLLNSQQAHELALRLTTDERRELLTALQHFESKRIKDEYEGQLAAHRWRSKFGRPSKVPKLGDVDPSGTFCPVPEDWLKRKYAETVPTPSSSDLFHLLIANSIPFIGFGFLDNFIMIVAGDSIDHTLGAYVCISTMAAAALGNTMSDVIGIGSAFYVERFAERVGFQPPKLTPIQLDMPVSRRASNMGRVFGITLGCLLGMLPLLFLKEDKTTKTPNKNVDVQVSE
ncbi:uncharacterized protein LOC143919565 [Arctopsyche grandis]|uniref:uncharacterized protein LOC143919565 n=1 Tax=Arctopsyche grandis TaxID=121162 RepID=UPI00406DA06E